MFNNRKYQADARVSLHYKRIFVDPVSVINIYTHTTESIHNIYSMEIDSSLHHKCYRQSGLEVMNNRNMLHQSRIDDPTNLLASCSLG